jgi:GNAT superfamily N-acetyltransferase
VRRLLVHVVAIEALRIQEAKGSWKQTRFEEAHGRRRSTGADCLCGSQPVAWCALAPRDRYPRFERSRVLKPVDAEPVWSITCFFVAKPFRGQGLIGRLLGAAIAYAREQGARIL